VIVSLKTMLSPFIQKNINWGRGFEYNLDVKTH